MYKTNLINYFKIEISNPTIIITNNPCEFISFAHSIDLSLTAKTILKIKIFR